MTDFLDLAKTIQKLIIDGNKEISDKLNLVLSDLGYVKSDISKLNNKIDTVEKNLNRKIEKEVKSLDDNLKLNYKMLNYNIDQAEARVKTEIKKVDQKLDAHLRVAA